MLNYQAPLRDFQFLLEQVFAAPELWETLPAMSGISMDLASSVLEQAARVATAEMLPVNAHGDRKGCRWEEGRVFTPEGFPAAFRALAQGGWLGIAGNPDFGGQGLPKMLTVLVEEMFYATNTSLFLYATLTAGAAYCIDSHGSTNLKRLYLPKLYDGTWAGAMALTEPQAGTDLGLLRTKAELGRDGQYHISGTKIFISGGEHDLTENIVHLVLARLADAPAGSKGISLFLVPKYLPDPEGNPGDQNGVRSLSIEHKMGINGSATSVMEYDGALGYLIGKPNQGLAAMFTMMNYERLSVGIQGLGLAAIASQAAAHYAAERLQGKAPGNKQTAAAADPILLHPDVRRMLLTQRALVEAGRAFAVLVGRALDQARYAEDAAVQQQAAGFVELLTPVAKAFLTDKGFEGTVLAQQVFGGAGYITETGVEQLVRDARIAQIYEGTNGVQAMDLVSRKVLRDQGATMLAFIDWLAADTATLNGPFGAQVNSALTRLHDCTELLVQQAAQDVYVAGAVAVDYLHLVGLSIYAWLWGKMAACAPTDSFGRAKQATATFYFARLLPQAEALAASVAGGAAGLQSMPDSLL